MEIGIIAGVLVELFDAEAAVGLTLLAAVIVVILHGLLEGSRRTSAHGDDKRRRPS